MRFVFTLCFVEILFACLTLGDSDTDHRIIGGRPANDGEFPYQVSIRKSYNDNHFCGGAIINSRIILTAAHCMFYRWGGIFPPIIVSVVVGQNALTIQDKSVYRNASRIIVHENFNGKSFANDIAIIELSEDLPINSSKLISQIDLQNQTLSSGVCTVSGWGVQNLTDPVVSEKLYAVDVNVVKMTNCTEMYNAINISLSQGMMCAGVSDAEKDACQGDSGGPLVCHGSLTGIVSTGKGCANPLFPGIYTDIAQFRSWINDAIKSLSDDTTDKDKPVTQANITQSTFLGHIFDFTSSGSFIQSKPLHLVILFITFKLFY